MYLRTVFCTLMLALPLVGCGETADLEAVPRPKLAAR